MLKLFSENLKKSSNFFRENFLVLKKFWFFLIFTYVDRKFSQESKNRTYKINRSLLETYGGRNMQIRFVFPSFWVPLHITLQGRGAKHFFTSGSGLLNSYPVQRHTTSVLGCPYPGLLAGGESELNRWYFLSLFFKKWSQNVSKTCSNPGPWTSISQSLMLVLEEFFQFLFGPSKIIIQTTNKQQRFVTLHLPLAEINYYPDGHTHRHGHDLI